MREITQSPLQSLYNCHPHAYFLIETVMHQASGKDWEIITEKVEIADENRLSRAIAWLVHRADEKWFAGQGLFGADQEQRYPPNHHFRFFGYRQVRAEIAPTTFLCRRCGYIVSLQKKIADNKLNKQDLICPHCKLNLKQVVHIFGHPRCGELTEITPQRCPECKQPSSLLIDNIAFGRSSWTCPQKHTRNLSMNCPTCVSLGEEKARMTPYAAGAAVKPVAATMVDIRTDIDWEEVARRRLDVKQESVRDLILEQYKNDPIALEAIKHRLDSDENIRRQMYEQFLEGHPSLRNGQDAVRQILGGEPPFITQRLLTEYYGTKQAVIKESDDPLDRNLRRLISKQFHLSPQYIPDLPILQIVYGYQVGSSNVDDARVRTFDRGWDSVALTNKTRTEAALFELNPETVVDWINQKLQLHIDEITLHKMLIQPENDTDLEYQENAKKVGQQIETLLHTLAHLLIRQSEIFTGLSRESLSEMIFAPALAFAVICEDGSELGALRSAFASYRLLEWFKQALFASRECALDPVCIDGQITGFAACHSCLFISERRCNGYWNEQLDRRLVSNMWRHNGFWDK